MLFFIFGMLSNLSLLAEWVDDSETIVTIHKRSYALKIAFPRIETVTQACKLYETKLRSLLSPDMIKIDSLTD